MDKKTVKKIELGAETFRQDLSYWMNRPAEERLDAVEALRREFYGIPARLQGNARVVKSSRS